MVRLTEADESEIGGKGASLSWLARRGNQTPPTWVVPPGGSVDVTVLDSGKTYAVRSSANVEDGLRASFAGQFETVLGVPVSEVSAAVATVRASASAASVTSYRDRVEAETPVEMTVLIQEMIDPAVSGVVFTTNPITGLNEAIVEAVAGSGDQLVQGGVTPDRWVARWGSWVSKPDSGVLTDDLARDIATEATRIAHDYGRPADLEWVWDGTKVWWLQIRPITGAADVSIYSNRISREFLPGMIKPLVWSVNVPIVNQAWLRLISEAIGPNSLEAEDLAKAFAYRAYFNMGAFGDIFELLGMRRDSLELLIGLPEGPDQPKMKPSGRTLLKTPRLIGFAVGRSRFGGQVETALPDLRGRFRSFDRDLSDDTDDELLTAVDDLMVLTTEAAYVNIVIPLMANLYTSVLRRILARYGIDLELIDIADEAERSAESDPSAALDSLAATFATYGADSPEADTHLEGFLDRFGHFSDSGNDFSVPAWSESPELVRRLAEARSHARAADRRAWDAAVAGFSFLGAQAARIVRRRAWDYQVRRDHVSSLYTYGYGLFRSYFLELGERFARRDIIGDATDIMYLTLAEVRATSAGDLLPAQIRSIVAGHKAEMERVADLEMPDVIYGDHFTPAVAASPGGILQGVATSRGRYRGAIRVVNGLADFDKVQDGDVLAIPYSDVGWTPLFGRAGAVVAEAGGMLSHSSIVAREYGIPCVVSVPGATRLEDGSIVTVDGYQGVVVVE
jgi:pyruvate,water dikinase